MLIHRAVIRQRIRNWAPFLVTECRFQDTRGCSEIVCQQVSGREKVEATLLCSVKHQKGKDTPTSRNRLRQNLAYFRQRQPPRCLPDHTQRGVKVGKNINFGATLRILLGRRCENRPTFLRKNMFYPLSRYITVGGSVLL